MVLTSISATLALIPFTAMGGPSGSACFECPPTVDPYSCTAQVSDYYGRPVAGIEVRVQTVGVSGGDSLVALTDDNGVAAVSTSPGQGAGDGPFECSFEGLLHAAISSVPFEGGTNLLATVVPTPDDEYSTQGFDSPDYPGRAYLYRSGEYDKLLIVSEPIDFFPSSPRTLEDFWLLFEPLLVPLNAMGFDVWLVRPHDNGGSLHDQAARFADAIRHALLEGGPRFLGPVVAGGHSMGGLVSRIATARWQGDSGFRAQLDLPPTLPLSLIVFGDAPLQGARLNDDLSRFVQDQGLGGAISTCAAKQMLVEWCDSDDCTRTLHNEFMYTGEGVPGCPAGPGVNTINGDGYAHGIPMIGYSNGTYGENNTCYLDYRDLNAEDQMLCPERSAPNVYIEGHELVRVDIQCWIDKHFYAHDEDWWPGSRLDLVFHGLGQSGIPDWWPLPTGECGDATPEQLGSGTFIPIASSLDASAPFGVPSHWTQPGDPTWWNAYNGTHGQLYDEAGPWLLTHISDAEPVFMNTRPEFVISAPSWSCHPITTIHACANDPDFIGLESLRYRKTTDADWTTVEIVNPMSTCWDIEAAIDSGYNAWEFEAIDGEGLVQTEWAYVEGILVTITPEVHVESPIGSTTPQNQVMVYGISSVGLGGLDDMGWIRRSAEAYGTVVYEWSQDEGIYYWETGVPLEPGENLFEVWARSVCGGVVADDLVTITRAPVVEITGPTPESSFYTNESPISIQGIAWGYDMEVVTWTNNGGSDGGGQATGANSWIAEVPLVEGLNLIEVTATDEHGYSGVGTIAVTYEILPPEPPPRVLRYMQWDEYTYLVIADCPLYSTEDPYVPVTDDNIELWDFDTQTRLPTTLEEYPAVDDYSFTWRHYEQSVAGRDLWARITGVSCGYVFPDLWIPIVTCETPGNC